MNLADILRPAWLVVDLEALEGNLGYLRERVRPAGIAAVLKADAYGHGAVAVGRFLARAGVECLAVALLEEGVELRRHGIEAPILVLGPARAAQLPLYARYRLTPTASSLAQLRMWRDWARPEECPVRLHLKVDTGMTRLGLAPEELPVALAEVRAEPRLELRGLLSHLADADDLESPRSAEQEGRFAAVLSLLTAAERARVEIHLAASAGALHRDVGGHHLVRLGLALFGLDPAGRTAGLSPVLSLASEIVQLKDVPAGARLGYGGRWTAPRPSRIAIVPVGYGDGYPWRLTNRSEALAGGRRVPVVGAVNMDMIQLDVTEVPAALGSEVVLLGRRGAEVITARELAERAGTIPYEILTSLAVRLPRRYRYRGAEVAFESRFAPGAG